MRSPVGCVPCRLLLLAALAGVAASKATNTEGGSEGCEGSYEKPVVNLCPSLWPNAKAKKVWMVVFYAPWCGHCRSLEKKYIELAHEVKGDAEVGIGAIDCSVVAHQDTCKKFHVRGYPTIKAIVGGKEFRSYEGARETLPMLDWLKKVVRDKGTRGGSAKCPTGLFPSKAQHPVVPLCEAHFPGSDAKNSWLVVFYDHEASAAAGVEEATAEAGRVLGNEPTSASNKAGKKRLTKRERATKIAKKYGFKLALPTEGLSKSEALVKVGAVCCDCDGEDSERFCGSILGTLASAGALKRPAVVWVDGIDNKGVNVRGMAAKKLVAFALERLGFIEGVARGAGASAAAREVDEL